MLLSSGVMVLDENPYQSPLSEDSHRGRPGSSNEPSLARLRDRLEAAIVDWSAAMLLSGPIGFLPMFVSTGFTPVPPGTPPDWIIIVIIPSWALASFAVYAALNYRSLKRGSQTLAMRWNKIKFVRKDGSPVTVGRILWRRTALLWPLYFVPGINSLFGMYSLGLALRASRFSLHDDIADTKVVKA